ncbi:MAG: Hint domain-containing protein [Roseicyclus sp.]|nr:Hint domain-containing protein [Roseicyclus sp.]
MTNFTEPSNLDQLIGLWDFRAGNETADTGLDDGIAQDGETVNHPADGSNAIAATFSGDQLIVGAGTNSKPTVFDVNSDPNSSADDEQFNLDRGTLEVQFTQSSHKGDSKDVIVSRGEKDIDEDDEGFFEIRVTESGRVEAYHNTNDGDAKVSLETSKDFFQPGDVVNVKYAFDVDTGVIMTVTNVTTGEVEVLTSDETGLTFDLTDNDDEEFTFGAREEEDGEYDNEFQGAIDYVALYSTDDTPDAEPDGIVDGEDFAEIMTPGYNDDNAPTDGGGDMIDGSDGLDDVIKGNGGDDSIEAGLGDDTVYGGEDGDTILGGLGDDLIYGDDAGLGNGAVRESFEWDLAPNDNANDFSQDTGNVTVDFRTISASSDVEDEIASNTQNVADIDSGTETVDENSSLDSTTYGSGNQATYELGFSDPVENVSFRVNDIDGDGVVKIQAFDANGNPIEVQLVGGSDLTLLDTDGVAGADTADSDGGYDSDTSSDYSVLVTIPGPVSEIRIIHSQDGGNNSGINVTDVFFDVPNVLNSPDGDDSLVGNAGDDTIFGEGGDDTIVAGAGDDVTGGEGDDLIVVDANEIDGAGTKTSGINVDGSTEGTDNDTLDLTDFEYYRNLTETNDPDGDSTSGTVEVQNADGDWVPVTFAEIENLILPDPEVTTDGIVDGEEFGEVMELGYDDANLPTDGGGDLITNDADVIEGNGGDDEIDGAGGDDTIRGGTGDDTIAGSDGTNVLEGGSGDDVFVGGDGADSFQGNQGQDNLDYSDSGAAVNVDLSTGALSGGDAENDTIAGGIDGVIGSEFDDTLTGFNHSGSTPADTFTNEFFGEGGNDTISGMGGDDLLDGGADDDVVDGGAGDDTVTGGTGNDDLMGGDGDDTVEGGAGSDTLDGGDGVDLLSGGDDDDDIIAGSGDTAEGGSGDDEFTIDASLPGDSVITIVGGETGEDLSDPTNGGDGDTLDLRGLDLVSLNYTPGDPEAGIAIFNNDANEPVTINFSEIENVLYDPMPDGVVDGEEFGENMGPGYNDDNLPTDGGGDMIDGSDGDDDVIEGNGGDDTINAGQGSDTVSGGTGDDSILGGASNDGDELDGDEGDDTIRGGGGEDTIDGGVGDDSLDGGADDDTITGGDGNDEIVGGDGDDLIIAGDDGSPDRDTPPILGFLGIPGDADPHNDRDTVNSGEGNDTVFTGDDNDLVNAGTGDDEVDGGFDDDTIDGGQGNDLIIGGEGSDSLLGGQGDDTIYGGIGPGADSLDIADDGYLSPIGPDPITDNGDDFIDGGAGNDLIFGNDDDDTILGGTGDDTISGGVDNDSISGGAGDDDLSGDHGDDFVRGNFGDDTLEGGRGSDTLLGDGDDDLIIGGAGDSIVGGGDSDTIIIDQNEVDGDGENDTAIYADGSGHGDDRDTLDLTDFVAHRNLVETPDGDGDSTSGSVEVQNDDGEWVPVTFVEIETLLLPPAAPDGIVDGEETGEVMELGYDDANLPTDGGGDLITNDADSIEGNGGDDSIQAAGGDDSVDGGTGDDTIRGNDGDDSLIGGAGEDSIVGGTGDDTIDGGEGDDTITGSIGNDSITDLEGNNVIDAGITGAPDRGYPIIGGPDADPNDDKDTVTTGAGDDTITTGDDDDVINAGDGDNVIDSGFDDDSITSGSGDDFITSGEGSDTVNSGDGDDTIYGGLGPILGGNANLIDENVDPTRNDDILDNGDDEINAGAGDDVVFGEDDNDTIDGGAGDDTLDGGIDDDTIFGGTGDDVIVGGQGADSLDGGTGDDVFNVGTFTDPIYGDEYVEGVGDTIVGGEDVGDGDEDTLDLTGSGSLKVLYEDSIDPTGTSGESGTVIFYTDNTQTTEAGRLEFKEIENVIPCFTPGAMIATPKGEVPVESLREGDRVITRDNGIQEIRWTGNRTLNRAELAEGDNLKPILIKAGSLGHNLPERDMLVSPQHRVLVTGETPQLYFEESEVLVAAKHLVGKQGVSIMDTMRTTYIHFMFDRHEVVLSDGAWTESFQPGDQSLGSMGEVSRDEIFALFPELATVDGLTDYAAARRSLKAHEAKLLQL